MIDHFTCIFSLSPRIASINASSATMFCPECVVCFLQLLHFRLDFIMKTNNMNPGSNIVCNIGYLRTLADKRSRQQVVTGGLRVNVGITLALL